MHIHRPATSQTDFPEIQEPDLEDRYTGCADGISRHFTGEVPVQKGKTEAQSVRGRANEVLSQCQFCRATMAFPSNLLDVWEETAVVGDVEAFMDYLESGQAAQD